MNVFSESFGDVQPKASVAANTGSGLDIAWGLHTLPQLFPSPSAEDERRRRLPRQEVRADGLTRPQRPVSGATTGSAFPWRRSVVT